MPRRNRLILRLQTICGCERLIHGANPEWVESGLFVTINASQPEAPVITEYAAEKIINCRIFRRVDKSDGSLKVLPGGIVNYREITE
jgi:hypothetical protein